MEDAISETEHLQYLKFPLKLDFDCMCPLYFQKYDIGLSYVYSYLVVFCIFARYVLWYSLCFCNWITRYIL